MKYISTTTVLLIAIFSSSSFAKDWNAECNYLAGNKYEKGNHGKEFAEKINPDLAIPACRKAVEINPTDANKVRLARGLVLDGDVDKGSEYLALAAVNGYAPAFHVMGLIFTYGVGDFEKNIGLAKQMHFYGYYFNYTPSSIELSVLNYHSDSDPHLTGSLYFASNAFLKGNQKGKYLVSIIHATSSSELREKNKDIYSSYAAGEALRRLEVDPDKWGYLNDYEEHINIFSRSGEYRKTDMAMFDIAERAYNRFQKRINDVSEQKAKPTLRNFILGN